MNAPVIFRTAPKALQALTKLEGEVESARTLRAINLIIVEARNIAAKAKAVELAREEVKEIADRSGRVHVKAERKLGTALKGTPKAKGTILAGRDNLGGTKIEPPKDDPTLKQMGVGKKRAAAAQKLAAMSHARVEELAAELSARNKPIAPSTILQADRQHAKAEKRKGVLTAVFSAAGPFGTAVIDPPWKMQKIDRDVRPNQDAFDYEVMAPDEIVAHFKAEIAPKLEADCHLFLWTTQKWLPASFAILAQIGFAYVFTMVWHKAGGFQPHDLAQYNCEFVVYARRGSPVFIDTRDFPCCFEGARREHSRKPDRFYEIVRRVTGGSRIDVFSREAREGFAQYGNEIAKFREAAA